MKKSTFPLIFIAVSAIISGLLAFSTTRKFNVVNYFTTLIFNATATKTLTQAITTAAGASVGTFRYYTTADNQKATHYSRVTAQIEQ